MYVVQPRGMKVIDVGVQDMLIIVTWSSRSSLQQAMEARCGPMVPLDGGAGTWSSPQPLPRGVGLESACEVSGEVAFEGGRESLR